MNTKPLFFHLILPAAMCALLLGLGWHMTGSPAGESVIKTTYHDRNGDGGVDLEKHHFPEKADADWEMRDDDHDGWYEKKISHGYAIQVFLVRIAVPENVPISPNP